MIMLESEIMSSKCSQVRSINPTKTTVLAVVIAMAAGCASAPTEPPHLHAETTPQRIEAIRDASAEQDRAAIPWLIDSLRHSDAVIRAEAIAALEKLTGITNGFNPFAPRAEREQAINRWISAVHRHEFD